MLCLPVCLSIFLSKVYVQSTKTDHSTLSIYPYPSVSRINVWKDKCPVRSFDCLETFHFPEGQ